MQHILVCAQDSVLAKKVRFLLARDEIDVEILSKPSQLEERLTAGDVALLIVSRSLAGEDAIDMLARFDPGLVIPPTLVLGGQKRITADFIQLIPDPIDTQAIYRLATGILGTDGEEPYGSSEEDLTHIAVDRPQPKKRPAGTIENKGSDALSFTDVTGLDEIANQLDELESAHIADGISDAFDIDEVSGSLRMASPAVPTEAVRAADKNEVLGGLLEPARFAKVLFQCWSRKTSGALIVARDEETLTVFFENGAPVHIESSIPGDPLGRALVTRGVITEDQYASAAKRAIERGLTIGSSLVELGCFSGEDLGTQKGEEATASIVGCFAHRTGAFEFDQKRRVPTADRPYRLQIGHILTDGIKTHCDDPVVREIIGDMDTRYFKLNRPIEDLKERFPITDQEVAFLEFNGRAYNVSDASEVSGLSVKDAHKLMAVLVTCEEVDDFTPGIHEFEARIREERQRSKELETQLSEPGPALPPLPTQKPKAAGGSFTSGGGAGVVEIPASSNPSPFDRHDRVSHSARPDRHEPIHVPPAPPPPPPVTAVHHHSTPPPVPPPNGDIDIPPMPVPANGEEGMVPRPLVYAKPLPRGPDGAPLETPERTLSREHFQRGVTLLGQGNFASAEEAFRDAVALCSEEHVYLIGLARAIYYNPGYKADGKVPVLRAIVSRAALLAPEDNRVATLKVWVDHAEHTYNVKAMA